MLVLTRKVSEKIIITTPSGDEIVVEVMLINHNRVRLGFVADLKYVITRDDVGPNKKKELQDADS